MRTRFVTVIVGLSLAAIGIGAAACGGSNIAAGTVENPITIGTGTDAVDPGGAPAATGGAAAGDPAAGKGVFTASCGVCHTLKDAGTSGAAGPNLDDKKPAVDKVVTQVTNGGGGMPPFKGKLSDADIANIAAYVVSVAGK